MIPVTLNVNGKSYRVEIESHWTLLRVLREELDLIGSKEGCGAGDCGACTVLIDGQAVNSCLYLAIRAEGNGSSPSRALPKTGGSIRFSRPLSIRAPSSAAFVRPV